MKSFYLKLAIVSGDFLSFRMRKILLNLAVSLDGLIEGPSGEFDWCFTDQDYGMTEFLKRTDLILFGRKSYDLLIEMDKNAYPDHKKIVFSRLATRLEGASVLSEVTRENIETIKKEAGGDIWMYGGASLNSSLMNLDLIDELHLAVHPVILGAGKPLFTGIEGPKAWNLKESKSYNSGLVQLFYHLNR